MKYLPAAAAVVAAILALISVLRGDWGVAVIGAVICAVATSAFLSARRPPPPPPNANDDEW